jgi:hypothetical protein
VIARGFVHYRVSKVGTREADVLFCKRYRTKLHRRRLDDVLPFFDEQLALDPVAQANWLNSTVRVRGLYKDWMASNWSSKMRQLRAMDTVGWAREDALEAQVHKSGWDIGGLGGGIQT